MMPPNPIMKIEIFDVWSIDFMRPLLSSFGSQGVQLYNTQAYKCRPAYFADSHLLSKFSSEVIADRSPIIPTPSVICERHTISVMPVTRITMSHRNKSSTASTISA